MGTSRKLTLAEFNSISTGIQSILKTTYHVKDIAYSCSFFATFGAAIMNKHLKIPSKAIAGAWFLRHPNGEKTLAYGDVKNGSAGLSTEEFHMWVETDSYILDFMSPLGNVSYIFPFREPESLYTIMGFGFRKNPKFEFELLQYID